MSIINRETFFRPPIYHQTAWTMPAELYNQTRWLLKRTQTQCVFIPIRTMQYLAIIDQEEIIFVDAISGYRQHNHQGGRIIQLAWQHFRPQARQAISDPVHCEIVHYLPEAQQTMQWLVGEFSKALAQSTQRYKQAYPPLQQAHIIPITSQK
jgi:hypothetical protein